MQSTLVSLALSGLARDAFSVLIGLGLAILIALAFVVASLASIFGLVSPADITAVGQAPLPTAGATVSGSDGVQVVQLAYAQIGRPYVWGGASPETSFDCSGLVQWVYRQVGVNLPRTAQQQYNATTRVLPENLRPGDLVFFASTYPSAELITHVGIYVGNGRMINAPTTGDVVREMPIFTDPYWAAHYAGAGRVTR